MRKNTIDIKIEFSEDEDVYFISSKAMCCSYVVEKNVEILKSEVADLVAEWIDIYES